MPDLYDTDPLYGKKFDVELAGGDASVPKGLAPEYQSNLLDQRLEDAEAKKEETERAGRFEAEKGRIREVLQNPNLTPDDKAAALGTTVDRLPQIDAATQPSVQAPLLHEEDQPDEQYGAGVGVARDRSTGLGPSDFVGGGSRKPGASGGGGGGLGGVGMPKDRSADISAAYDQQKAAQTQAGELAYLNGMERAGLEDEQAKKYEAKVAEDEQKISLAREGVEQERREYDEAAQQLKEHKIDPDQYWKGPDGKEDWSKRTTATLAIALGGFAAGLRGDGVNSAMTIIDGEINRNIMGQEKERERLRLATDVAGKEVDFANQKVSSVIQDTDRQRALMLEGFQMQLKKIQSEHAGEEKQAAYAAIDAELEAKKQEALAAADQRSFQNRISRQTLAMRRQEHQMKMGGGAGRGKQLPANLVEKIGGLDGAVNMLEALGEDWEKSTGPLSFVAQFIPMTPSSRYEDQKVVAAQVIGRELEGGVLKEPDFQRYLKMMPEASDSAARKENKIRAIRALIKESKRSKTDAWQASGYDASGIAPVASSTFVPRD